MGHRQGRLGEWSAGGRQDGPRRVRRAGARQQVREPRLFQRLRAFRGPAGGQRRVPGEGKRRQERRTNGRPHPGLLLPPASVRRGALMVRGSTRQFDFLLVAAPLALVAYGAILIYSGSLTTYGTGDEALRHPVARQVAFAAVGVVVAVLLSRLDYHALGYGAAGLYISILAVLVFVLVVGSTVYGSRRWIEVGGTHIQPSEIAKLGGILVLAKFLSANQERLKDWRIFLASLAIAAVPAGLVFAEPDLGSAVVFAALWLGMVMMAGARIRHV